MLDLAVEYIKDLQKQFKVSHNKINSKTRYTFLRTICFPQMFISFCRLLAIIGQTANAPVCRSQSSIERFLHVQHIRKKDGEMEPEK